MTTNQTAICGLARTIAVLIALFLPHFTEILAAARPRRNSDLTNQRLTLLAASFEVISTGLLTLLQIFVPALSLHLYDDMTCFFFHL